MVKKINKQALCALLACFYTGQAWSEIEVMHWWTSPAEQELMTFLQQQAASKQLALNKAAIRGVPFQEYFTSLRQRIEQHTPPDFAQLSGHRVKPEYLQGLAFPHAKPEWDDWIPLGVQDTAKHQGQWFAVPVSVHAINWLWVNNTLWRQMQAPVPDNWQELLAVLQQAKNNGWIGLAISGSNWEISVLFSVLAADVLGADHYRRILIERKTENGDKARLARIFARMRTLQAFIPDNYQQLSPVEAMALMQEGKALMKLQGTWANAALSNAGWQPGRDYECFHFPGTQAMPIFISDLLVSYAGSPASAEERAQLTELLISRDFQQGWSLRSGGIPARVDVEADSYNHCSRQVISDMRQSHMRGTVISFKYAQRQQIEQVMMAHFHTSQSDHDAASALLKVLTTELK